MNKVTVENNGVSFVLSNTIRSILTWRKMTETMDVDPEEFDSDIRSMFVNVASHTEKVIGAKWTPPSATYTKEELVKSYEDLCDVISLPFLSKLSGEVGRLLRPLSDDLEKPDSELTEAELADPNL